MKPISSPRGSLTAWLPEGRGRTISLRRRIKPSKLRLPSELRKMQKRKKLKAYCAKKPGTSSSMKQSAKSRRPSPLMKSLAPS